MDKKKISELWLKNYNDNKDYIDSRIKDGIEKYRKGNCKLKFIDEKGEPIANKKVKIRQLTHDFKYGAHIFMLDEFEKPEDNFKYREIFKQYFNLATVPFYWAELEPEEGKPRYDKNSSKIYRRPAPDLCVEYCEESGISSKVHCLVYDKFIPDWLPKSDMAKMERLYENRIKEIACRYKGKMFEFEVINETLSEYYWNTQSAVSTKKDVIEWSFGLARKYLPDETLVINDGNYLVDIADKDYRHPYYMLIENALLKGVKIDKIGVQNHIYTGASTESESEYEKSTAVVNELVNPVKQFKGLDCLAELGLPIEITEVTIPTFGFTDEDEELQSKLIQLMYSVWFSHPNVNTVVYWNTVDGYCYDVDGWKENNCKGGLFHHDLTPKKSALMFKKLFTETWHTEAELITDDNGCVGFRGFFGDYTAEADGDTKEFGLHNDSDNNYIFRK